MNNKTLFYSKFIYKMSEGGPKPQEVKAEKPKDQMKGAAIDAVQKIFDIHKNPDKKFSPKEKKALVGFAQQVNALNTQFQKELKGKSPKAAKALLQKFKLKIKAVEKKAENLVQIKELAENLKTVVDKQYKLANAQMMKLYDDLPTEVKVYTEKKHVQMLVDAYLIRWQNNAKADISKLSTDPTYTNVDLKILSIMNDGISPAGEFQTGKHAETLNDFKKAIKDNLAIWKNPDSDEWRKVYKDSNWDTKWEKGARAYAAKAANISSDASTGESIMPNDYTRRFNKAMKEYKQKNPPPLPNGDIKYQHKVQRYAQNKAMAKMGISNIAEVEGNPAKRKQYWNLYYKTKREYKNENPPTSTQA